MLTITLLGTAATMPLPDRALTAAVAECGGHSLLFDCGEGTQTAARRAGVNLMKMDAVCLTHYHGDHIFGLPGLLQTLGCQGRTRPLALYGPKGLGEVWANSGRARAASRPLWRRGPRSARRCCGRTVWPARPAPAEHRWSRRAEGQHPLRPFPAPDRGRCRPRRQSSAPAGPGRGRLPAG